MIILILAVFLIAFCISGRSLYMPMVNKIKGKETIESIMTKIEEGASNRLKRNLEAAGYKTDYPQELILVAFKEEQRLQIYATDNGETKLIKSYPFTATSGQLGPKLKEGDKQIPEGIYEIEYWNPNSSYYLSIKVNYPNDFDKSKNQLSTVAEMGGDIFIHGKSATIGCIPIGDPAIEELFLLTRKASHNKVKIIISPRDFRYNSTYPEIVGIDWEGELYAMINQELKQLQHKKQD